MPIALQADRPLHIFTPLGDDVLMITALRGEEGLSKLFSFEVDLLASDEATVDFERILGQEVRVELRLLDGEIRYFSGLVKRFTQGGKVHSTGEGASVQYRAEIVPGLWLLTKRIDCRVFQQLSVPDILRQVLAGQNVNYELSGTYPSRDYCVQFNESDFSFVSRLMEEEGIRYYFNHSKQGHELVIADGKSPIVDGQQVVVYDESIDAAHEEMRILSLEKTQELRAAEYVLRDHCFQLPGNHLEAKQAAVDSVTAGAKEHKLSLGHSHQLEIYEYPAGYAKRFDGIGPGGNPRPEDLDRIYQDRERTARLRMEREELAGLEIRGSSNCGHFSAGYCFTMTRHFNGNGNYLLASVEHEVTQAGYRAGQEASFSYTNRFTCVPEAMPFRPQRATSRPLIAGVQTATVTGPSGEEIFCDKYGRVKVQFHWDRKGKMDALSSCWVRVSQVWAGKGWGAFFWPRIGHEVVVAFENGDPDCPLIVGSVYNAANMPWFDLPANNQLAGFKSASVRGHANKNFNGLVFNDRKGQEHLAVHSERNLSLNSELDKMINSGRHKGERVALGNVLTVGKLVPGGGSGGGFDEGNSISAPPPAGIVGINSAIVYGDNMQMACPVNHQLAIGNNIQICINPVGLMALGDGAGLDIPPAEPIAMQALMGSGLGGNMQFTIGTSAQFTVGQSYEISIGPRKIEIHAPYSAKDKETQLDVVPTITLILCEIAGVAAVAFALGYDLLAHHDKGQTGSSEQEGDKERMLLVLGYQLLMDGLLTAIIGQTSVDEKVAWVGDDAAKEAKSADPVALVKANDTDLAADAFGCLGLLALLAAQCSLIGSEV